MVNMVQHQTAIFFTIIKRNNLTLVIFIIMYAYIESFLITFKILLMIPLLKISKIALRLVTYVDSYQCQIHKTLDNNVYVKHHLTHN